MGMEVGVANELVVAVEEEEEEGGGHKTSRDTERVDAQQKGRIASSECFFVCVLCVQSKCNNVQQTAAALRPRLCAIALRFRPGRTLVYAPTSTTTTTSPPPPPRPSPLPVSS